VRGSNVNAQSSKTGFLKFSFGIGTPFEIGILPANQRDWILDLPLAEHPSPSDVSIAVSDLVSDLTHYASIYGVASEVLAKAFQNYLAEISGSDAPQWIVDLFRAYVDGAIYEVTIGAYSKS
jgi:hypothetical protein